MLKCASVSADPNLMYQKMALTIGAPFSEEICWLWLGDLFSFTNNLPRFAMADSIPSDYCHWCAMDPNHWDLLSLPYLTSLHSPSCKFFSAKRKRQEDTEEVEEHKETASKKLC